MSERDRDDDYGETTMDEPRDLRTWEPASGDGVAPGHSSAALAVEAAGEPYAAPIEAAQPPSARSYASTAPLPAQGPERAITPPPKYGPTVPLPAGELPSAGRRDFGPTEIDDPIDLRIAAPARTAPSARAVAPIPPAESGSDLGLKITLGVLVFLIVAIVAGIIGAIVTGGGEPSESTTESAQ